MMSAVGDAVQVLPVVGALKRAFPRAHITWLIQPLPHSLVAGHPAVDDFVIFQRGSRRKTPAALTAAGRELRRVGDRLREVGQRLPGGAFDLVLGLQVYLKAGILTGLAPGRVKLGFDWRRTRDLNCLFSTRRIPPNPQGFAHTQDQYFEFLRYLGVDPEPVVYGLELTPAERQEQRRFFDALDRPACSVVLTTSDPRKDWRPDGYAAVLNHLYHDFGLLPLVVGGRSPREIRAVREVTRLTSAPVLNATEDGLRRLLWLLSGSKLVISPDTGPLHIARAVQVPVVGLYGFTNPRRSGPYRRYEELVVDGYARYPGEEYPISMRRRRRGMRRIEPEMVLEKVQLALRRYGGPSGGT
jgi:heptosyltransferase I